MSIDREAVRVGLNTNSLEADAVDARTPSGRHEEVVAALLAAIVELQDVVIGITACPDDAASQHELDTVSPHRLGGASPSAAGSRAMSRGAPSTTMTSPPRRRTACAISTPTGPPPSTSSRRGTAFIPVASRLVQMPCRSRSPGIGGITASEPVATTMFFAVWRTPYLDGAGPCEPARAAKQLDALACEPFLLPCVGVIRDHEVTPGKCGRRIDLCCADRIARTLRGLSGAEERLRGNAGVVRALTADQLTLDKRDTQTAVGELACAVLARRAAADDDDVEITHVLDP